MAIKGSLKEASLPDVLQLLAMGKKTGCLSVTHRNNFGYIYFDKGRICYASIVNRRDRLGDMLVKDGADHAGAARRGDRRARTAQRDKRLGELLVAQGAIAREELHATSALQIEEAVYYLFTWNAGDVQLRGGRRARGAGLPRLDQSRVAAARGRAPRRRVEPDREEDPELRPRVRLRPQEASAESGVELTREQQIVAELLDGRRDVAAVIDESGLGEFDVGKALYGLVTAGFAAPRRQARSRSEPAVERTRASTSTATSASRSTRPACSTRRCASSAASPSCARAIRSRAFYVGLVAARGRASGRTRCTRSSECVAQPGARARRLPQPRVCARAARPLRRGARRRSTRPCAAAARTIRAIQTSLRRARAAHAATWRAPTRRCRRRAPLFGTEAADGGVVPLRGAHGRARRRARSRDRRCCTKAIAAHPHAAVAAQQPRRRVSSGAASIPDALRWRASAACSRTPALAAAAQESRRPALSRRALRRRARGLSARREAQSRARRRRVPQARQHPLRRQEREEAIRCWERALELDPTNAIVRTNLETVRQVL